MSAQSISHPARTQDRITLSEDGDVARVCLRLGEPDDYSLFLKIKSLPRFHFQGRLAEFPTEYLAAIGLQAVEMPDVGYEPMPFLFDYQADISRIAIRKRKFAGFLQCGLGKTLVLTEFARHAASVLPGKRCALIVSPLMVVRQTLAEVAAFYGDSLPIEQVPSCDLQAWLSSGSAKIGITNYEAIREGLRPGRLGSLILDECFPKGTLVDVWQDGEGRQQPIETIRPGDRIVNAAGVDVVADIHRREVPYAVRINCGGKAFIVSPNHPLFTRRGWIGAQDLEPGDSLMETVAAVRMVQQDLQPHWSANRSESFLQSILFSEMANESTGACGESSYSGSESQAWESQGCLVRREVAGSGARARTDSQLEPDAECGVAGEGEPHVETHETQTFRAWREREGSDTNGADDDGCSWSTVGSVCRVVGPTNSRLSNALQDRLRESRSQSRHRGGWQLALRSEGSRPKEGCEVGFARVDSLEVLEQGHPDLDRLRDADGKLYFYDLGATRHPSFSVEGFLVHNSSLLKSHYGAWGQRLIDLGKGLPYKLCLTGTPAPNDRIEFANHAVFLDQFPTVNSFLARYFVNRGQTGERWELKSHALRPFYRALSHWCIFLESPATYGWKDNVGVIPPVEILIHDVTLTDEQQDAVRLLSGNLFGDPGGMVSRGKLSQLAKGRLGDKDVGTNKPGYIRDLIAGWNKTESTLVWCRFNHEQESLMKVMPDAASIAGDTPLEERERIIADFQAGRVRTLITKPKVLGYGLNLQIATRQVFSSCEDSWESFHQAVKRSNRIGSTRPLRVHLPVTPVERPMMENVLRKAGRVMRDSEEQEKLFKEVGLLTLEGGSHVA